ncbi:MAG: RNase adapter RapZ [Vampirovibrionales bacterium]|nr:RNase adapter RapZ [Vampirovibrionales bacterium]
MSSTVDNTTASGATPALWLVLATTASGLSIVLDTFRHVGIPCLQGLALNDLPQWLALAAQSKQPTVIMPDWLGSTNEHPFDTERILEWQTQYPQLTLLLLDAPADIRLQRLQGADVSPLQLPIPSLEALQTESEALKPYRQLKSSWQGARFYSIQSHTLTEAELVLKLAHLAGVSVPDSPLTVTVETFGFKHGAPTQADCVFDMRFLPNPYYDPSMRPLSGLDKPVQEFLYAQDAYHDFLTPWLASMKALTQAYYNQGKRQLTLAVGCTGGQHRSVCLAKALADHLSQAFPQSDVRLHHRDARHWPQEAQRSLALSIPTPLPA